MNETNTIHERIKNPAEAGFGFYMNGIAFCTSGYGQPALNALRYAEISKKLKVPFSSMSACGS